MPGCGVTTRLSACAGGGYGKLGSLEEMRFIALSSSGLSPSKSNSNESKNSLGFELAEEESRFSKKCSKLDSNLFLNRLVEMYQ